MKSKIQCFLLLLSMGLSAEVLGNDFWEDRERGWYWFEENKMQNERVKKKEQHSVNRHFDADKEMQQLQKSIQQALNLAILVPTEPNIQNYLHYQIKAFTLSQRFTEAAKVLQLKQPELDYQIEAPYNHQASMLKNQEDRTLAELAVEQLSHTHGLFFFFDARCPYCVAMGPNVLSFAKKHGFHVISVSINGSALKEFPNAVPDNGIANAYGVTHLPALFAVNPRTHAVLKLANRVTSVTELEDVVLRYQRYQQEKPHGR